jgi:hypothetical protein
MSGRKPTEWRKCGKCIADGRTECHVAQEKAETPQECKGPFRSFVDMKIKERKERQTQ